MRRPLLSIVFLMAMLLALPAFTRAQEPGESRDAPRMSPSEFAIQLRLAEAYEEHRDAANAARIYGQLYTLDPNNENVFGGYTRSLIALKHYDDVEKIVNQRLQTDGSLDMLLLSARIEAWMNKRPEAMAAFQKAEHDVNAKDCAALFPIVYAMMDVSYNQDALNLLDEMRKHSADDMEICSSQIAGLYLRLGDFDRASKEFIAILKAGEGNVGMVEQRLAEYLTDSLSRTTVLGSLEQELLAATNRPAAASDTNAASGIRADLRLLAWLYGETHNYSKALATMLKLDDLETSQQWGQGAELLQFADRARAEGALDVAARAYSEASSRLGTSHGQPYYVAEAQLGSLKTWEAYFDSRPEEKDSLRDLVGKYEAFAAATPENDFALDALVHAGTLAYARLFEIDRASKDFESILNRARGGLSEPAQKAAFGLVDLAYASENFSLANSRLAQIEDILHKNRTSNEKNITAHLLYERALGEYYQARFDSSLVLLDSVAEDAESDYANDAIALAGVIQESNTTFGLPSLTHFAKGALAEQAHNYNAAEANYRAIIDSEFNAPLADDAALHSATVLVELGRPADAERELDSMQVKMVSSPLLDVAAFREAEIVERDLHDKARAQKMYEDFLDRYPNSNFVNDARDRARKLRGDAF